MTIRKTQVLEDYRGSLAELAIAATKSRRDVSWAEIARDIRAEIGSSTALGQGHHNAVNSHGDRSDR